MRQCLSPPEAPAAGCRGHVPGPLTVARNERKGSKPELLVEDQAGLAPALCGYGRYLSAFVAAELIAQPVNVTRQPWLQSWG